MKTLYSLRKFGVHKHFLENSSQKRLSFARAFTERSQRCINLSKRTKFKNTFINYLLLWTSLSGPYWQNTRSNGLLRNAALVIFAGL